MTRTSRPSLSGSTAVVQDWTRGRRIGRRRRTQSEWVSDPVWGRVLLQARDLAIEDAGSIYHRTVAFRSARHTHATLFSQVASEERPLQSWRACGGELIRSGDTIPWMAMDRAAAQRILDDAALETEKI